MNHQNPRARDAADLSRWPAAGPLSVEAGRRREEILGTLQGEFRSRRRRRTAVRAGVLGLAMAAAVLGASRVMRPAAPSLPPVVRYPGPAGGPSPVPAPLPGGPVETGFRIATIETDRTVTDRLAAPSGAGLVTYIDDDGLAPLLRRLGEPGLIKIDGRVILSRDSTRPAPPSPQSRAAPDGSGAA